jgi:dihydroxyacetone kinase-like protein
MQRIVNNPDDLVNEMLEGFVGAHSDLVEALPANPRVLKYIKAPIAGKVGVITGGGSGHKPAFIGYIGENMLDAVAAGEIFSSPTAKSFRDAIKAADSGQGVAVLYGNYSGDNMNVKMARADAEDDGITVKTVVANDDVASAPKTQAEKRRGVAGEVFMWKVGGAKAAMGGDLDEVIEAAQKAIDQTRSVGIGLSSCTIPAVGKPNFHIEPGTMELGIGHHGEPGLKITQIQTADEMAAMCLDLILPDLPFKAGCKVAVLVSGLGATPASELYVFYRRVSQILKSENIDIHRAYVGNYFTSLDMMGVTLTVMKLDDELKELIDHPCNSIALKQF